MSESPRRSSFNMLSRRKSGNMKKGKKAQAAAAKEAELQRQASIAARQPPPKLPQLYNGLREPVFETRDSVAIFGPDSPPRLQSQEPRSPPRATSMDAPRAVAMTSNVPIPPIPSNGGAALVDVYARTESMTNRGRYSYASSSVSTVNNPRKVRRRKDPTPFK